jgi:dynein heavy chain 1
MVDFFLRSQERFTQDMQPHYVYSPREMTRWVRGIYEAIRPLEDLSIDGLVRLWAHEALRLFHDRLVTDEERMWTNENVDEVALKHFPSIDRKVSLKRPILYSNWMTKNYVPVERDELRDYVKARLKVFYEEELDVPLVLFHEVIIIELFLRTFFLEPLNLLFRCWTTCSGSTASSTSSRATC